MEDSIQAAYASIVASWRAQSIRTRDALAQALDGYRVRFSYHSGRIENANITYHDTRSLFPSYQATFESAAIIPVSVVGLSPV